MDTLINVAITFLCFCGIVSSVYTIIDTIQKHNHRERTRKILEEKLKKGGL